MEEQKREFRGIWIPKEIYLNKSLNWNEKILLIEIDSLDNEQGCFSSNKHFAEFLGVTERAVTGMIAKLKKLGYISQSSFDGRRRVLHSNVKICLSAQNGCSGQSGSKLPCTPEAGFQQNNPVNNISNNIENKDTPLPPREGEQKKDSGKAIMGRFEVFYKAYPKHKSRGDAEKAWKTLKPDDKKLAEIMDGLERAKCSPDWKKENGRFIPYPASWLRAKGWEDEQNTGSSVSKGHTEQKKGWGGYLC